MAATTRAKKSSSTPMPIDGYDRLSIKEIVPRLATLSGPELKAVAAHEKAGKNRVTLLRAVRKVELDRDAAAQKGTNKGASSKRLAVVEPEDLDADHDLAPIVTIDANNSLDPVPYLEVVEQRRTVDSSRTAEELNSSQSYEMADDFDNGFDADFGTDADADVDDDDGDADADAYDNSRSFDLADFDDDFDDDDDEDETVAEVVVAEVVAPKRAPKAPKAPKAAKATKAAEAAKASIEEPTVETAKASRPRPVAKAATWEEEVRPQLPRRMEAAAVALEMELEPQIDHDIDMEPYENDMRSVPTAPVGGKAAKAAKAGKTPKAGGGLASGPMRAIKKFENVALVMAAILAILLGLAIGTVLARTGTTEARQAPATVVSESAAVNAGS
jgi:hypothetical protein